MFVIDTTQMPRLHELLVALPCFLTQGVCRNGRLLGLGGEGDIQCSMISDSALIITARSAQAYRRMRGKLQQAQPSHDCDKCLWVQISHLTRLSPGGGIRVDRTLTPVLCQPSVRAQRQSH